MLVVDGDVCNLLGYPTRQDDHPLVVHENSSFKVPHRRVERESNGSSLESINNLNHRLYRLCKVGKPDGDHGCCQTTGSIVLHLVLLALLQLAIQVLQLLIVEWLLPGSLCLHLPLVCLLVEVYLATLNVLEKPWESNLRPFRSHVGGGVDVSSYFLDDALVLGACCLQ